MEVGLHLVRVGPLPSFAIQLSVGNSFVFATKVLSCPLVDGNSTSYCHYNNIPSHFMRQSELILAHIRVRQPTQAFLVTHPNNTSNPNTRNAVNLPHLFSRNLDQPAENSRENDAAIALEHNDKTRPRTTSLARNPKQSHNLQLHQE